MPIGIYKRKAIIKSGQKFNKLTAVRFVETRNNSQQFWLFRCDCGKEKVICVNSVKFGRTKSCGCLVKKILLKRNFKHGMTKTKTFKTWSGMKLRCLNKNDKGYKNYGGRGITICKRWMKFENFYKDMGERPKNKSLDRIDNNGNYSKENCRWANSKQQNNNKRSNHLLTYNGKTQNLKQWSEELGIKNDVIRMRLKSGWSVKRALLSFKRK